MRIRNPAKKKNIFFKFSLKPRDIDDPVSIHSSRIIIKHPSNFLNQLNLNVKQFPDLLSGKNFKYLGEIDEKKKISNKINNLALGHIRD